MKIKIIAVGNKLDSWLQEGIKNYINKFPKYTKIEWIEIKPEKKFSSIEFESLAEKSMIIGQSTIESAANLARNKKIQKITISCLKSFPEIADSFPNLPKTKESVELAAKLHLQELKLQNIEEYNDAQNLDK